MPFIFFIALFLVLLIAGLYLEKLTYEGAIVLLVLMVLLLILFVRNRWSLLVYMPINLLVDAVLMLKIFDRDVRLPPGSGWMFR